MPAYIKEFITVGYTWKLPPFSLAGNVMKFHKY